MSKSGTDIRDIMTLLPWKKSHCREKDPCGFTLLEVLVSISILAIGILAVGSMQVTSIKGNAYANRVTEASILARDRVERLMALAYTDPGLNADTYHDPDPPTGYTIDWEICDGGSVGCAKIANTKLIEVTVAHGNLRKDIKLMNIKPMK